MQASRHQVQCTTAAVRPPASAPAASKRQRVAAAVAVQRRRQPATACGQRRRGLVLAAAAASGGDAGDDYEELLERRDELLRLQGDELREALNTDEDEELADLTERGCCAAAACATVPTSGRGCVLPLPPPLLPPAVNRLITHAVAFPCCYCCRAAQVWVLGGWRQ